jgi:hypothetical protein
MTLRDDGTLDVREQELLDLWSTFCQDRYAATFIPPGVESADEFSNWLSRFWKGEETIRETRAKASAIWSRRDLGLYSWERELLQLWGQYAAQDGATDFVRVGLNAAHRFADWLANREPESRAHVEELDLSVRAFNLLRSRDMRFIDQVDLDRLGDPVGEKVKAEIAEKLGRWRGDDGTAGVPSRL